jgi:hypothetical protein
VLRWTHQILKWRSGGGEGGGGEGGQNLLAKYNISDSVTCELEFEPQAVCRVVGLLERGLKTQRRCMYLKAGGGYIVYLLLTCQTGYRSGFS